MCPLPVLKSFMPCASGFAGNALKFASAPATISKEGCMFNLDDHNITDICGVASILIVQIFTYMSNRRTTKQASCEVQTSLIAQTAYQSAEIGAVKQAAEDNGKALTEIKEAVSTSGSLPTNPINTRNGDC